MRVFSLLVVLVVFWWSSGVSAVPIEWTVASGGNGHFYEFVDAGQQIDWTEAKFAAEQSGGYLAVITSASEDNWVITNVMIPEDPGFIVAGPWIGGFQNTSSPSYSEPAGGWEWVNGEAWSYTGWNGGQPSNTNGNEGYLHYHFWSSSIRWNDRWNFGSDAFSYIVEYDTNPVPEPSTALLLGLGLTALAVRRGE